MTNKKNIKKILILGGAGFIGLNLSKHILKNTNYIVTIADNFSRGKKDSDVSNLITNENINLIEADLTKSETFSLLEKDYDQCYMLASVVGVDNALSQPSEVIRINTSIILNTLEWLKDTKLKKVIFSSTSENYAGTVDKFDYKVPTDENVPLTISDISHPRYTYAVTKMLGESGFLNYSNKYDFDCTILRYHNVYGPRMGFNHVIPNLIKRFIDKETPFQMYGHNQTRSFCFISDAVEGTFQAMESKNTSGEIYHIGTSDEITIEELIKEVGTHFNYSGNYDAAPSFPGSTYRRCPDISKATSSFLFKPKISLKIGLKKTLKWYLNYYEEENHNSEQECKN